MSARPSDELLVRRSGGPWHAPEVSGYAGEAELQALLFDHPQLIPGIEGVVSTCREFNSTAGPADLLVIRGDGSLVVVECKLAKNPQVRREVVGQVLDYASRLWRMPGDEFAATWTRAAKADPYAVFEDSADLVRLGVEESLRRGRFTIVLAVDGINADLRRMVEYLNEITRPEVAVLAFELARVADGDVEVLLPKVFGEELTRSKRQTPDPRDKWSIQQYLDYVAEHDSSAHETTAAVLNELESLGWALSGGRAQSPSLNASIEVPGVGWKWPICFYTYPAPRGAVIEVRFEDFKKLPIVADKYVNAVARVSATGVDADAIREVGYRRRPGIPLSHMSPDEGILVVQNITEALTA